MALSITFNPQTQLFHLRNEHVSYIMEVINETYLAHCYWGTRLESYHKTNQFSMTKKTFAAFPDVNNPEFSLEFLAQEFPIAYQGDYKNPAMSITLADGTDICRLIYQDYRIIDGAPELIGLPHARENINDKAKTLIIRLLDKITSVQVELFYTLFEKSTVIIRSSKVTNIGQDSIILTHLASASLDCFYEKQLVTNFFGSHQQEFQLQTQNIPHGQYKIGSSRGASGPQYAPFIALSNQSSEHIGNVYAMTLIYSGNHVESIERDQYDQLRLQIGLNPDTFSWKLAPNKSFQSPQAVLVFSPDGFNGMSQNLHEFSKLHLSNPNFNNKNAPILINSWEMTYFDVNEKQMLDVISTAARLNFEAVVLDDGWFLGRNSSQSSLGDWSVDKTKFPNDLFPLVKAAHSKGLKFGIWFEPEMISPNSHLLKEHPDWVVKSPHFDAFYGRTQFVLDLTQTQVQNFLIATLTQFIKTYNIDYIKWDMNRHIVENSSQAPTYPHPKEFSHRYMLGLYRVIDTIVTSFPDVFIENCSSGGGRFDFGMLYYFPQTWVSDNTDGYDRQLIQYGASYLFHPSQFTGHVSSTPNHQTSRTTPLETRMNLASSTNMGYELNLLNLTADNENTIKKHISQYKNDRILVQSGRFYRLQSPFNSNHCSWLFESQDKSELLVFDFRNHYSVSHYQELLKIPYVDEKARYYIAELNLTLYGNELIHVGIHINFPKGDFQSIALHLKRI